MAVSVPNQLVALNETFQTFNQLTESLESTYLDLEDRVAQLHIQLDDEQKKRKQENDERNRISQRLNSILQALPAGVIVLDDAGGVYECNPAAVDLLGGPLRGEVWLDVVARAFSPRCDDGHDISLKDGRLVNISTCPLGNEPGQILLVADVTETRRLQKRLNQHQRLISMGEMAAKLSHQIRTPLASVLLSASSLKNTKLNCEIRAHTAEKVISQLRHLESIVNDMLLFSRDGFCGNEIISLNKLVDTLVNSIACEAQTRNIELHVKRSDEQCNVDIHGNQSILLSAMQNILQNALQAIDSHGRIDINIVSNVLGSVDIEFVDDGPGIDPALQDKIFEPFYTTKDKGTGLGLAVVQSVARAHQGELWLDSHYKNGCKFIMRFPVSISLTNRGTR